MGGSCRVLNSLGKERGWWRGLALGIRRRTGGTRSTFVCTSLCASMNWQHLSEETHGPSSLPSPSRSPQEKLHHPQAWSFSTLGQYLAPPHFLGRTLSRQVFSPSVSDGPASDMAESIIHAIVLPRCSDGGGGTMVGRLVAMGEPGLLGTADSTVCALRSRCHICRATDTARQLIHQRCL